MKYPSYNYFFMNFANKTRLEIILSLRNKPLSVNEITKIIGKEQSVVSHNLRKLYECHILNVRKEGKRRVYSLNKDTVVPILKIVERHVKKNCLKNCNKKLCPCCSEGGIK